MKTYRLEEFKINKKDCFIQYGEHEKELELHKHDSFIEIVYVLEGKAKHRIEEDYYYIRKGDLFVVCEDQVHGYEEVEGLQIINIMIYPKLIKKSNEDVKEMEGYKNLFHTNNKLHVKEGREEIYHILRVMIEEYESTKEGSQSLFQAYFMIFIVLISRYVERIESKEYYCLKIKKYIERNYKDKITVKELTERSPWSSRQLARNFKEVYDCSLMEYVTKVRLKKAIEYVKEGDKIIDIAYKVGFNDSNYFSKRCKEVIGKTPTELREGFKDESNRRDEKI